MKKIKLHPSILQIFYLIIYLILFLIIILTPTFITRPFYLTKEIIIEEEIIEIILLSIVFLINVVILNLYKKEIHKQKIKIKKINENKKTAEERLIDSLAYIGKVNVQIEEFKSIFNSANKYPETKNDFKKVLSFFAERTLSIVNTNWVLFRIIKNDTQKTMIEHFKSRNEIIPQYPHVSNKKIINNKKDSSFTTVISNNKNLNITISCTLEIKNINNDQKVFLQAITNELTMLFIILNSSHYKNGIQK